MTQTNVKPLTPLSFQAYLEYGDGSDTRYDLLATGELIEVPSEAEIHYSLVMSLYARLAALVNFRLIWVHVLTMEVEPVGDNYRNRRPDLAVLRVRLRGAALARGCAKSTVDPNQQLTLFEQQNLRIDDFRNRLVWDDNKLVMASLLQEFKGKVDVIYLDPTFDVGTDFSMSVVDT